MSDKILCIGGVVDGLRTRDSGPDAFFQEPMSLDALSRIDFTEPGAHVMVVSPKHRYRKQKFCWKDAYAEPLCVEFYVADGMTPFDAMLKLMAGYKP